LLALTQQESAGNRLNATESVRTWDRPKQPQRACRLAAALPQTDPPKAKPPKKIDEKHAQKRVEAKKKNTLFFESRIKLAVNDL
jgi:hypothetical protein